jgi:type IV conjugative transfer system coupling protein TraD
MAGQLMKATFYLAFLVVLATMAFQVWYWSQTSPTHATGAFYHYRAKIEFFRPDHHHIAFPVAEGQTRSITYGQIRSSPAFEQAGADFFLEVAKGAYRGFYIALVMVTLLVTGFIVQGRRLNRSRRIKGANLVSAKELDKKNRQTSKIWSLKFLYTYFRIGKKELEKKTTHYSLANVSWCHGDETKHSLLVGTTGSGKTVAIMDLLDQIEARNDAAIVYDKMNSFIPYFYRPERDVILNPFDKRGSDWCLFKEAQTETDFSTMAAALIPLFKDNQDPFWVNSARILFASGASALWNEGDHDMKKLTHLLLEMDMRDLAKRMKDTKAQSIIDEGQSKTALSVRSVLSSNVQPLTLLPPVKNPFSVREWVQKIDDERHGGFLFLSSTAATHEVRRSQIATQIELALIALMSMPVNHERRVWLIIDELPSLHQIPSISSGLTQSRQFGGCIVLGSQVFAEIRDLYGREAANTISGNCNTRLCLSTPDMETARWLSDSLGRELSERMNMGFSYGAEPIRDGMNYSRREDLQPIVLPSDIMGLPKLRGYLKMPFSQDVAKIRLKPRQRKKISEGHIAVKNPVPAWVLKKAEETDLHELPETETTQSDLNDTFVETLGDTQTEQTLSPENGHAGAGIAPAPPMAAYENDAYVKGRQTKKKIPDNEPGLPLGEALPKGQKNGQLTSLDTSQDTDKDRVTDILEKTHPQAHLAQKPINTSTSKSIQADSEHETALDKDLF